MFSPLLLLLVAGAAAARFHHRCFVFSPSSLRVSSCFRYFAFLLLCFHTCCFAFPPLPLHQIGGIHNDALRFGLHGVKSDIVISYPLQSSQESDAKIVPMWPLMCFQ